MLLTMVGMAISMVLQHQKHQKVLAQTPVVVAMRDMTAEQYIAEHDLAFTYAIPKPGKEPIAINELVGHKLPRQIRANEPIPLNELTPSFELHGGRYSAGYKVVGLKQDNVSSYRSPRKGDIVQLNETVSKEFVFGEVFLVAASYGSASDVLAVWIHEKDSDWITAAKKKAASASNLFPFSHFTIYQALNR